MTWIKRSHDFYWSISVANTIYVAQGHYNLRFFGRIRINLSIKYLGAFQRETSVKLAMRILLKCNRVSIAPRGEICNCIIQLLHKQEIVAIWSSKAASQSRLKNLAENIYLSCSDTKYYTKKFIILCFVSFCILKPIKMI